VTWLNRGSLNTNPRQHDGARLTTGIQVTVTDQELLGTIQGTKWIADLLTLFDFEVGRAADGLIELVTLPGGEPLRSIAGDASGGSFHLVGVGEVRPVLYVGSEGEGGLIAASLRGALALVVGVSSVHDATVFSLEEDDGRSLREYLARADDEIRKDWPGLDDDRARLRQALALPPVGDALLQSLHTAAADFNYRPINRQGDRYRPMLAWLEEPEEPDPPTPRSAAAVPARLTVRRDETMPGQLGLF
jgi:hypothetical protein